MTIVPRPVAMALVISTLLGGKALGQNPPESKPQSPPLPFYVVVGGPKDLSELWRKIADPDFVVVKPPPSAKGSTSERSGAPSWVIEAVDARGRVEGDSAAITVDFAIDNRTPAAVWVPFRLDDQRIATVREGARDLPLRMTTKREWEALIEGAGVHHVRVTLRAAVLASLSRNSLSVAIPEAPSTSLDLEFPGDETDFVVGASEDYGQSSLGSGRGKRVQARLSPRSRIEIAWGSGRGAEETSTPLLTAEGDVAIEIDLDQMRVQSSWAVRAARGPARELEFRLADDEEVDLARIVDDPAEPAIERSRGVGALKIRLGEPLRPGSVKRLVLKTHRPLVGKGTRGVVFAGHPLVSARRQTGAIGLSHGPNLWVSANAARGLLSIDPQKLPIDLRARPDTTFAFEFLDQPFKLELAVEPSPPLYQASSAVLLIVEPERVLSETRIELEWVRGRLDEVELEVGRDVQIESVGPNDLVAGTTLAGERSARAEAAGTRRLKIRLTPTARDRKRVILTVAARQRISATGSVSLGLVSAGRGSARFAIRSARALLVELDSDRLERLSESEFSVGSAASVAISRRAGDPGLKPAFFAAGDGDLVALPLRIVRRPRELSQESRLTAHVGRLGLDVVQRTRLRVRHGLPRVIEIATPPEIGDRWEILDQDVEDKHDLGRSEDGVGRARISFTRPFTDQRSLSFRYRIPFEPALDSSPRSVTVPRIMIVDALGSPTWISLELDPELRLEGTDLAWTRSSSEPPESSAPISAVDFVEASAAASDHAFVFSVRAAAAAPLPGLVVSRLLIRSAVWNGATNHRAWCQIESHGPSVSFDLPPSARLIDVRLDGRAAEQVEQDPANARYRTRLPLETRGRPVLLEIGYETTRDAPRSTWVAPRLEEGAAVLQSVWEIRLPWYQEIVGAPEGWTDDNEWYWDRIMWKRRPTRSGSDLLAWVEGSQSRLVVGDLDPGVRGDGDRFVFSMTGLPQALAPVVASRLLLTGLCSGTALVVGFLVVFRGIRFRVVWAVVSGIGLLAATVTRPSVVFLVLQSSFLGLVLVFVGLVIERVLERSRRPVMAVGRPRANRPAPDSSLDRGVFVGSDVSTAIRVRAPSTMDHPPMPTPPDSGVT